MAWAVTSSMLSKKASSRANPATSSKAASKLVQSVDSPPIKVPSASNTIMFYLTLHIRDPATDARLRTETRSRGSLHLVSPNRHALPKPNTTAANPVRRNCHHQRVRRSGGEEFIL